MPERRPYRRSTIGLAATVLGVTLVVLACGDGGSPRSTPGGAAGVLRARSGGMTTAFDDTARSFSLTARNINHYERQVFADGKDVFEVEWVADAESPFAGLGPHYDATACADCHTADGRAAGPTGDGDLPAGFIVKLATSDDQTAQRFGNQLTRRAEGAPAEAVVSVTYREQPGAFADGAAYSLRVPRYVVELDEGELPDDAVLEVRVAPHLSGLGLLELIPDDELRVRVDVDDADGDGISGRPGAAVALLEGRAVPGRFGWNATQPTVEQQSAVALFGDLGLTSRYFPSPDCDSPDPCDRRGAPVADYYEPAGFGGELAGGVDDGASFEVTDEQLFQLTVYTQALAVPGVRDLDDPEVQRGWELFNQVGCAVCHAGPFTTGEGALEGLSNQTIHPYTDLLLHDLGDGLADRTVGGDPVATEWRTPPLWGIGLIETVNGHTDFLHDGRARNLSEAILWHGGEAEPSTRAYREMSGADRAALVRFLEAL